MKKVIKQFAVAASIAASSFYAAPTFSATNAQKEFKLAVIDINMLMHESDAAKQIQEKIEKKRSDFQKDVSKYETELRSAEEKLVEAQKALSSVEFDKKRTTHEKRVAEVQKIVTEKGQNLEASFNDARQQLVNEIMRLVAEQADANGYTIVIPKNVVMFREDHLEITAKVLEKLNKTLPSVKINLPT